MKKFKISFFAVLAIALGISISAFTVTKTHVSPNSPTTVAWFKFVGSDPTSLTQVQDNTNYSYVNGMPCSTSGQICAVKTSGTPTSGQQPDPFSSTLKSELQNVIDHGSSYSDISKQP
jgi:hypothetical protein